MLLFLNSTLGNANIGIGALSGENMTSGNHNIVIGNSAWLPNASGDNQLNIGNIIYGNSIDGSASTVSSGNIGIGITNPSQKLDVAGAVKFSGALMPNNTAGTVGQVLTSAGAGAVPTWNTPASTSTFYNADGSLTGNRTVTMGTNTLAFTSAASSGTSHFAVDGTTFNIDAVNNRVGIGSSTPVRNLDVIGSNAKIGIIAGENENAGLHFGTNNSLDINGGLKTAIIAEGINSWSKANLHFCLKGDGGNGDYATIGNSRMMIRNDGNVGIGTINPLYKLHVINNSADVIRIDNSSNATAVASASNITLQNTNNTTGNYSAITSRNSAGSYTSSIEFINQMSNAGDVRFVMNNGSSIIERFRITGEGNVGIGINSPTEKLDVSGAIKFSGALMPNNIAGTVGQILTSAGAGNVPTWTTPSTIPTLYNSDGSLTGNRTISMGTNTLAFTSAASTGTSHFAVDGTTFNVDAVNNRVGIGTINPTAQLHVSGSNQIMQRIDGSSNIGTVLSLANSSTGGGNWQLYSTGSGNTEGAGHLLFNDANGLKMIIKNDGNVGIGTTNPTGKLDVVGGKIKVDLAQTLTINPNDNFTYASNTMSHYGIGWFSDSWNAGGSTAYLSSYAGIKFFTQGSLGMSINQAGTTSNTSGSWSSFSDARIKTVKSEFKDGLSIINQINPVTFVYNENAPFKSSQTQIGIVAQELEKIAPYMVTKTANGEFEDLREVNNQAYVFLLINAVKEQQIEIENLKTEVNKLKK